jgi:DNA-binding NarL/FixJ family response regulator
MPVDGGPLGLTPTELEVAKAVAKGLPNSGVAAEVGCRTRTVGTHLSNIYAKLEIGGPGARVRLGNRVREANLID